MSVSELPKRSAFVGPQRSVYCGVPTELMERYLEALHAHEWTDTEQPEGCSEPNSIAHQCVNGECRGVAVRRSRRPHTARAAHRRGIHRLPSLTKLPDALPGTIMFDAYPDLANARELLSERGDLWDAVRDGFWAALLNMADPPPPGIGG